jgi:disulfide bond formation protein DsbB
MDLISIVNKILAVGAVGAQIFLAVSVIYIVLPYKIKKVSRFFSKNGMLFAFIVSVVAAAGSLFYSNYAGFEPCQLCWFQRIFMYPEVLILGLALIKKDEKIVDYGLLLAAAGFLISVYQNYISFKGLHSTFCTAVEPCTIIYVLEFGYIIIPMMALTAFSLIILFLSIKKYGK